MGEQTLGELNFFMASPWAQESLAEGAILENG